MKYFIYLMFPVLLSCAGENENSEGENTAEPVVLIDDHVAADLEGLTLNNGKKWKVDRSTEEGMKKVENMLNSFSGEDLSVLGKDIKDELSTVIKGCDFKGEDHDQYHIILHAMLKEAKRMKKGKSSDPKKMEGYLDAYDNHFEVGDQE